MKRIAYSLLCCWPGELNSIDVIGAKWEFDLVLMVQDLRQVARGMSRGVFAAYCNVNFASKYAKLIQITHTFPFVNKNSCAIVDNGVAEWGAMQGLGSGNTKPIEVSRIRFKALWPTGIAPTAKEVKCSFRLQFAKPNLLNFSNPMFNSLIYGNAKKGGKEWLPGEQSTILVDDIESSNTELKILKTWVS